MSLLEKAKGYFRGSLRKTALAVAPLALLAAGAAPAKADVTLSYTGGGAFEVGSATATALPAYNGVTGLKLSGNAQCSSSFAFCSFLQLFWSGQITGLSSSQSIPVSLEFTVSGFAGSGSGSRGVFDWFVFNSGSANLLMESSGIGTLNVVTTATTTADLTADGFFMVWLNVYGNNLTSLTVPTNSIDLNAVPTASPVPEPGTYAMLVTAGGALILVRRRRKPSNES